MEVYVYMCVYGITCLYVRVWKCMCIRMYESVYVYVYGIACIYVSMEVYGRAYVYETVCVCIWYESLCVYMQVWNSMCACN